MCVHALKLHHRRGACVCLCDTCVLCPRAKRAMRTLLSMSRRVLYTLWRIRRFRSEWYVWLADTDSVINGYGHGHKHVYICTYTHKHVSLRSRICAKPRNKPEQRIDIRIYTQTHICNRSTSAPDQRQPSQMLAILYNGSINFGINATLRWRVL